MHTVSLSVSKDRVWQGVDIRGRWRTMTEVSVKYMREGTSGEPGDFCLLEQWQLSYEIVNSAQARKDCQLLAASFWDAFRLKRELRAWGCNLGIDTSQVWTKPLVPCLLSGKTDYELRHSDHGSGLCRSGAYGQCWQQRSCHLPVIILVSQLSTPEETCLKWEKPIQ